MYCFRAPLWCCNWWKVLDRLEGVLVAGGGRWLAPPNSPTYIISQVHRDVFFLCECKVFLIVFCVLSESDRHLCCRSVYLAVPPTPPPPTIMEGSGGVLGGEIIEYSDL